ASTERETFYALHDKRGYDGIEHTGVLPNFTGIAVHDGFRPYRGYRAATHALCNAHHLRELLGVIEQDKHGHQTWAWQTDELHRSRSPKVAWANVHRSESLDPIELAGYRAAYAQIIALGHHQNPPPTVRIGKRGPIAKSDTANLLARLDRHREEAL